MFVFLYLSTSILLAIILEPPSLLLMATAAASTSPVLELKKTLITDRIIYFDTTTDPLAKTSMRYNINRVFRNPTLMSGILEYVESYIEKRMPDVTFDTILPLNLNSTPFASDIATTMEKSLVLLDTTSSKFTTTIEPDERILLVIDTVRGEEDYILIDNTIKRLKRYDSQIVGILTIFDQDIGEFIRLSNLIPTVHSVFSFNDLCEIAYNNHLASQFDYEKYKFYSEKMIKQELIKLNVDIDTESPNAATKEVDDD